MEMNDKKYRVKKVCGHYILVKREPLEETSAGGIVIARLDEDAHKAATTVGTVIDIGPTAWADPGLGGEPWCEIGDKVLHSKWAGKTFGEDYILLADEDVVCVLEDNKDE